MAPWERIGTGWVVKMDILFGPRNCNGSKEWDGLMA